MSFVDSRWSSDNIWTHLSDTFAGAARGRREGEDMKGSRSVRVMQLLAAAIAVLFGVATLFASGRVLLGSDPGYVVFRPLLIYNTIMGVAYLAAGITIWRSLSVGKYAAGAIFLLNILVLLGIIVVYQSGGAVAVDSLGAMTLRTVVWLVLFLVTSWLGRSRTVA
jgi:hypothetical protein